MTYSISDNFIKVELNNKLDLLNILEQIYNVKNVFQLEFNFMDIDEQDDNNSRYVRCYLVFNSNEEANDFETKLLDLGFSRTVLKL